MINTDSNPHSDLYCLLVNLESMVRSYSTSATTMARLSILKAIGSETKLLTRKLSAMHQRWLIYLPFHEVIDVHFDDWAEKAEAWTESIKHDVNQPSTGFLLDLMGDKVDEPDEDLPKEVNSYCAKIDKRLIMKLDDWEGCNNEDENEDENLNLNDDIEGEIEKVVLALAELRDKLTELEEFFSCELGQKQFIVLALRLRARDCRKVEKEAANEVRSAHNAWPQKYIKERAKQMKDNVKLELLKEEALAELPEYIDLDDPVLYDDACFGQFLFKSRQNLTTTQVQQMVKRLEIIRLCNEYMDPNGKLRKHQKNAQGRELTDEEKRIVKQLITWAERVEWRGGATIDTITMGIKKMLGVGHNLEGQSLALSDQLWKLLKTRRNCDADKSLMVTWLNIVGWCVRRQLISGASPALCKLFFTRCGQDDYKAIDKGKNDPSASFMKIESLLEKYLK